MPRATLIGMRQSAVGFELLAGRTADVAPGSTDLPKVVAALDALLRTPRSDLPLTRVDQRWAAYTDPDLLPLLDGDYVLHTDMAPRSILIDRDAHLIDWAWPTRGLAWVGPAVQQCGRNSRQARPSRGRIQMAASAHHWSEHRASIARHQGPDTGLNDHHDEQE